MSLIIEIMNHSLICNTENSYIIISILISMKVIVIIVLKFILIITIVIHVIIMGCKYYGIDWQVVVSVWCR